MYYSFPVLSYLLPPESALMTGLWSGPSTVLQSSQTFPGVLLCAKLLPELCGRYISSPSDVQYRDLTCKQTKAASL